jgi:hypothetical protein
MSATKDAWPLMKFLKEKLDFVGKFKVWGKEFQNGAIFTSLRKLVCQFRVCGHVLGNKHWDLYPVVPKSKEIEANHGSRGIKARTP